MTEQEKELLLKDLCARLPYDVICRGICNDFDVNKDEYVDKEVTGVLTDLNSYNCCYGYVGLVNQCDIEFIRPYLRPISSMTEEKKREYCDLQDKFLCSSQYLVTDAYELFDWLNRNHFDYRNLIEKGLALEALEGMYKK